MHKNTESSQTRGHLYLILFHPIISDTHTHCLAVTRTTEGIKGRCDLPCDNPKALEAFPVSQRLPLKRMFQNVSFFNLSKNNPPAPSLHEPFSSRPLSFATRVERGNEQPAGAPGGTLVERGRATHALLRPKERLRRLNEEVYICGSM